MKLDFKRKLKEKGHAKIVCLGDSVTHGYFESGEGLHGITDYEAVYHYRLKKIIEFFFAGCEVAMVNAGVGGDTASKAMNRIEDVISEKPDLVIVSFGLNDVYGELSSYIEALKYIWGSVKAAGAEVVFMTPNMLNTKVTSSILCDIAEKTAEYQDSGRMDQFIKCAIEAAEQSGVAVCDCYSIWKKLYEAGVDTNFLLANRINHPLREMHQVFANALFETIFM